MSQSTLRMPDARQLAMMEAKACQFADALLSEGHALGAPDKALMTRMLALRAASKVIARIAKEAHILPSAEVANSARFFGDAVGLAMKDEIAQSMKVLANAAALPGLGG